MLIAKPEDPSTLKECLFDYQDLRDTNISYSSLSDCFHPASLDSVSDISAASIPKLIEKCINSGREEDHIRISISIRRICPLETFIHLLQMYWFHLEDHGDLSILKNVLNLFSTLSKILSETEISKSYLQMETWIDETLDDLLEHSEDGPLQSAVRDGLIQSIKWLRYEWDVQAEKDQHSYLFFDYEGANYSYNLTKKPRKLAILKRNHQLLRSIETSLGPCEYLVLDNPERLAAHLSLIQENLLRDVKWPDIYQIGESSKKPLSKPVQRLIDRSNILTHWAIHIILFPPHDNHNYIPRNVIIEKIFGLAAHLYRLQNYDCLIPLLLALQHPSITRLSSTWDQVPKRIREQLGLIKSKIKRHRKELLTNLCSPSKNWLVLRESMQERVMKPTKDYANNRTRQLPSPAISYFGIIVNDLTMNREAKQDVIPSSSIIFNEPMLNVKKLFFQADTVADGFCLGCQGVDIMGRRCRSTYWNTLFLEKRMQLRPHLYLAFSRLEQSIKAMISRPHPSLPLHPSNIKSPTDFYAISKLVQE